MQIKKLATIFVVVTLLMGCSLFRGLPVTPADRFDEARARWNSTMTEYRVQYALQIPETQAKWDKQFAMPLYQAGLALGFWGDALYDTTKEQAFTSLKNQAIALLLQYKIIEIKE